MASKSDLIKSMEPYASGAWISKHKLKQWLGYGDRKLNLFCDGLDMRISGNRKLYLCSDVAAKIQSEMVRR